MESISYSPAVHTNEYYSNYTLLEDEQIIDIQTIHIDKCINIRDNKPGCNGNYYTFFMNFCIFFTNFGRIFRSQVNLQTTEVASFSETIPIGVRWSYEEDFLKAEVGEYSHPRQLSSIWSTIHQMSGRSPTNGMKIPIELYSEDLCSIKIPRPPIEVQKEKVE